MRNTVHSLALATTLLLAQVPAAPAAFAQLLAAPGTTEVELPAFQPGLWDYQRTAVSAANPKPQKSSVQKCSDPSKEIRDKLAELRQRGCQFSAMVPRGNQYLSTWRCSVASGVLVDRNVVTVQSNTSYQDDNEVHVGEHVSRSTVVAKRVADCPLPGSKPSPGAKRAR